MEILITVASEVSQDLQSKAFLLQKKQTLQLNKLNLKEALEILLRDRQLQQHLAQLIEALLLDQLLKKEESLANPRLIQFLISKNPQDSILHLDKKRRELIWIRSQNGNMTQILKVIKLTN